MAETSFTNATAASRYELRAGDELVAILDYRDNGQSVAFTRTFTIPSHRGKGYAAEITSRAVADVEETGGRTIEPVCWFVADWFTAHPEHAAVLAPR